MDTEHIFSHIVWKMKVYRTKLGGSNRPSTGDEWIPFHYRWVGPEDLQNYAFPNVFVRIMKEWQERGEE